MNKMWSLLILPFRIIWFVFKLLITIMLLFLGPFGWAFVAAWYTTGKLNRIESKLGKTN